ncbi:MAG TPA: heat-inducible transcriptional repressor HrcA [Burkholderiales bacterium]|nr:heat-inducible transcriptional repressor HrcA [Burkholderiales bacterium]
MLNERAQSLLKTLVERYIIEGQPVGSRALSKYSGLELSPASIRNIMADLEDMGLIVSPHTSAGRVPTPRGYRLFVDTLLTIKPLEQNELQGLQKQLHSDDPQKLVSSASQLLSELTRFAGLVMAPRRRTAFRHVEFLSLSEKRVLLIIVSTDGDVQNRIILTEKPFTPSQLVQAANYLNQNYAGLEFDTVRESLAKELRDLHQDISRLMSAVVETGGDVNKSGRGDLVLTGEHKLLNVQDLSSNMDSLRKLFAVFDEKTTLMQLMEVSNQADGVKIFIGGESDLSALDEVSIVTAPYEVNGQVVGAVAVIGPTRMAYERVIPIVDVTAKLLSSALSY